MRGQGATGKTRLEEKDWFVFWKKGCGFLLRMKQVEGAGGALMRGEVCREEARGEIFSAGQVDSEDQGVLEGWSRGKGKLEKVLGREPGGEQVIGEKVKKMLSGDQGPSWGNGRVMEGGQGKGEGGPGLRGTLGGGE